MKSAKLRSPAGSSSSASQNVTDFDEKESRLRASTAKLIKESRMVPPSALLVGSDGRVEALPEFYFQILLVALRRIDEQPFKFLKEKIYKWMKDDVAGGDDLIELEEFVENLPEVCHMSRMSAVDVEDLFRNVNGVDEDDEELEREAGEEGEEKAKGASCVVIAEMITWLARFDGVAGSKAAEVDPVC